MFDHHRHDHHYHNVPQLEVRLRSIESKLDLIKERFNTMAKTLQELVNQGAKIVESTKRNDDLDASFLAIHAGDVQTIKDLRTQLGEAGNNQAKLDELGTTMDGVIANMEANAQRKLDAMKAGTEAA